MKLKELYLKYRDIIFMGCLGTDDGSQYFSLLVYDASFENEYRDECGNGMGLGGVFCLRDKP